MSTEIGKRNKRVEFQRPITAKSGLVTWVSLSPPVWAKISTQRSDSAIQDMANTGTVIHNVNINYRRDIKVGDRMIYAGKNMMVIAPPIDVNKAHEELDIKVKESA